MRQKMLLVDKINGEVMRQVKLNERVLANVGKDERTLFTVGVGHMKQVLDEAFSTYLGYELMDIEH